MLNTDPKISVPKSTHIRSLPKSKFGPHQLSLSFMSHDPSLSVVGVAGEGIRNSWRTGCYRCGWREGEQVQWWCCERILRLEPDCSCYMEPFPSPSGSWNWKKVPQPPLCEFQGSCERNSNGRDERLNRENYRTLVDKGALCRIRLDPFTWFCRLSAINMDLVLHILPCRLHHSQQFNELHYLAIFRLLISSTARSYQGHHFSAQIIQLMPPRIHSLTRSTVNWVMSVIHWQPKLCLRLFHLLSQNYNHKPDERSLSNFPGRGVTHSATTQESRPAWTYRGIFNLPSLEIRQ